MTWNYNMNEAPKGSHKEVAGNKGVRKVFVPEWCFVMLNGKRYWTHRLESGRWNGFTDKEAGDCWHPAPAPPTDKE